MKPVAPVRRTLVSAWCVLILSLMVDQETFACFAASLKYPERLCTISAYVIGIGDFNNQQATCKSHWDDVGQYNTTFPNQKP